MTCTITTCGFEYLLKLSLLKHKFMILSDEIRIFPFLLLLSFCCGIFDEIYLEEKQYNYERTDCKIRET